MVGRSVGRKGVGRQRALSDSGWRTDRSFHFFLEPPKIFSKKLSSKNLSGQKFGGLGWAAMNVLVKLLAYFDK